MSAFACTRCGKCCKATFFPFEGHVLGLNLDPSEIGMFPKESVFPLFGRGRSPIEVVAYQLGEMCCPLFDESDGVGKCAVHKSRPRACAAFPLRAGLEVSVECPGIASSVGTVSFGPERQACEEMDAIAVSVIVDWVWPLDRKCWVPLLSVVRPKTQGAMQ